jgi:hypothetical protein
MAQRVNDNHTGCPPGSTDGAVSCTTRTRTTTAGSPTRAWSRVRYPRSKQEEQGHRSAWPWLPGSILEQCGPDEWYVCVEVRELAVLRDGRRAPRGTASRNLYYPCCFRDGSEIRPRTPDSGAVSAMPGLTTPGTTGYNFPAAQAEQWQVHGRPRASEEPCPARVAELLGVPTGARAVRRRRVTSPASEAPFQLVDSWIHPGGARPHLLDRVCPGEDARGGRG